MKKITRSFVIVSLQWLRCSGFISMASWQWLSYKILFAAIGFVSPVCICYQIQLPHFLTTGCTVNY